MSNNTGQLSLSLSLSLSSVINICLVKQRVPRMHVRARTHTPAQTGANNAGASIIYDSFEFRVSRLSRALLPIFVLGERGIEWLLSKWMYCRRENGLRFSHTGTASLTVPRSVSTGFVNHARLTDHSARHKALASCKETPLLSSVSPPIWQLDSSVTMVSLVSLRKKKKEKDGGEGEKLNGIVNSTRGRFN